jgi:hypothetical protein
MADKKISALTSATTPLAGTEVLPIVQSGATVKVAVSDLTAGRAISATQLTLTTGNLIVASGQGIDFSATPGTGTSELFNDYEEGTWTPAFAPASGAFTSVTYITQRGRYTKIGRSVTVNIYLLTSAISVGTASGAVLISGLPFTCDNQTYYAVPFGGDVRLFGGDTPSAAQVDINSTNVSLWYRTAANGATTALDVTDLGTGGADNLTIISGTYFV